MKTIENIDYNDIDVKARTAAIKNLEDKIHEYLIFHGFAKINVLIPALAEHWVNIPSFDIPTHIENMVHRSVVQSLTYLDTDSNKIRRVLYPNNFSNVNPKDF